MSASSNQIGERLDFAAARLVAQLERLQKRIVFAESCTAGLIVATLARVPGVSQFLCGSAVVYRETTKTAWLDVSPSLFSDPACGVVSGPVAEAMCQGVLDRTPEADIAAAITGHLGPDAPAELDGVAFVAIGERAATPPAVECETHRLELGGDASMSGIALRHYRQQVAALRVLEASESWLAGQTGTRA